MKDTDKCNFCQVEKESYTHLFVLCEKVRDLWLEIEKFKDEFNKEEIDFGLDTVICNRLVEDPGHIKNFICLLTKQYIYRQRCMNAKLSLTELKRHIFNIRNIEKFIAVKNGHTLYHECKWGQSAQHSHSNVQRDRVDNYIV